MSRTNDVYSLPAGSSATANTTIESAKFNAMMADIEADLNAARPILAGGTGAITAVGANDGLNTTSSNIASASTTDLSTMTGVVGTVTGTTTITAFGTVASGAERVLIFAGILILTHNATSLILPGAANITTAAGDIATLRSKGSGNWVCVDYQKAANSPGNLVSPTLVTPSITTSATITATNDGATGALLTTQHISASPAASDVIADWIAQGKDSAGNTDTYGNIQHIITDPTSTSEDSVWAFLTRVAGTLAERFRVGAGLYMTGATGGDPGAGKINATALQVNGTQIPFSKAFESTQQTITLAGSLTLAHGLGVQPKLYAAFLQCTTAESGYSIADEVQINPNNIDVGSAGRGQSMVPDATNINIRYGNASNTIIHKTTGAAFAITNASWKLVIRAWA